MKTDRLVVGPTDYVGLVTRAFELCLITPDELEEDLDVAVELDEMCELGTAATRWTRFDDGRVFRGVYAFDVPMSIRFASRAAGCVYLHGRDFSGEMQPQPLEAETQRMVPAM